MYTFTVSKINTQNCVWALRTFVLTTNFMCFYTRLPSIHYVVDLIVNHLLFIFSLLTKLQQAITCTLHWSFDQLKQNHCQISSLVRSLWLCQPLAPPTHFLIPSHRKNNNRKMMLENCYYFHVNYLNSQSLFSTNMEKNIDPFLISP